MPFTAIASAVARTSVSLQSPANVFHVFQPMGGVRARPSNLSALAAVAAIAAQARRQSLFIGRGGVGCRIRSGPSGPTILPPARAKSSPGGRLSPGPKGSRLQELGLDQLAGGGEVDQRRLGLLLQGGHHLSHLLSRLGPGLPD